ncbi:hypothetical protein [Dyella sp.]|uniref:hypothetical protein n=1 Tax=Dyella sp. TaxID=1869338 RepID=UPI002ED1116F
MARIEVVSSDASLGQRLGRAWSYPLRGAALATCVALTLSHYVALLPTFVGTLLNLVVWTATWRYAADCLLHSAHGYADPPDVSIAAGESQGWMLTGVNFVVFLLCLICAVLSPGAFWPLVIMVMMAMPAIDMSIAFDGNLLHALNPFTWLRVMAGFGVAYLLPVIIHAVLGIMLIGVALLATHLPRFIGIPLEAFIANYLVLLVFHIMGSMIHQRHDVFGLTPQAHELARANKQDADALLLEEVAELEKHDPRRAIEKLVARMQDRSSPASLHQAYRRLLASQNLRDGLLVHGQIWIAALVANGELRRALSVLQECSELDPQFLPDDPDNARMVIDMATRSGMNRLAVRLCRSFIATWPRHTYVPQHALLAARLLNAPLDLRTEAIVLLGRVQPQWPDHPLQGDMQALMQTLQAPRLAS